VITTFMALLSGLQNAALAALVHLKLGQETGVRGRDIMKALMFSILVASTVGSLIVFLIFSTPYPDAPYGFGGSEFPSPTAQLFGFLVISLRGLAEFQLPGTGGGVTLPLIGTLAAPFDFIYLLSYGVIGALAGRHLLKMELSPISLAVGLLIPPATSVTMVFGGIIDYRLKKKRRMIDPEDKVSLEKHQDKRRRMNRVLSGAVSGEAIVTILFVLAGAVWSILVQMFI
jgi:hypothetical protein